MILVDSFKDLRTLEYSVVTINKSGVSESVLCFNKHFHFKSLFYFCHKKRVYLAT